MIRLTAYHRFQLLDPRNRDLIYFDRISEIQVKLRGDCESRKYKKTLFFTQNIVRCNGISGEIGRYREKIALAGDYLPLAGDREFTPEIRRVGIYGLLTGMIFCFRHRKNTIRLLDHSGGV